MSTTNTLKRVDYFHTTIQDQPGEAYRVLNQLAELGVNLQAISVVPVGPHATQMTIFPEDSPNFEDLADRTGMQVSGPHPAILVQGNDKVGALTEIHEKLFRAGVNVYAASGVSSGDKYFGYIIYVRPEHFVTATEVLGI